MKYILFLFFSAFVSNNISAQWIYQGPLSASTRSEVEFEKGDSIYECYNRWNTTAAYNEIYFDRIGSAADTLMYNWGFVTVSKLFFINKDTGFYISDHFPPYFHQTNDGGATFISPFYSPTVFPATLDYQYLNSGVGFSIASSPSPVTFHSCNFGSSYTNLLSQFAGASRIYFNDINNGFIFCVDSTLNRIVARTIDQGHTWTNVLQNITKNYNGIHFPSLNTGYVVGDSGSVYKTMDGGIIWTESIIDSTIKLNDVFFINDSCGFAVGDSGSVYYTNNGAATWQREYIAASGSLFKIKFVSDSVGYIAGKDSVAPYNRYYKTTNRGITGISENTLSYIINLFPNPVTNKLTINIDNNEPTEIILYDLSSRKLLQQTFTNTTTLNTEQLAKGMYLYTVRNRNRIIKNGKVIKQ